MDLLKAFDNDHYFRFFAKQIMQEKSRLRYKRDELKRLANMFNSETINISMKDVRQLHYLLHPMDNKRIKK